MSQAEWLSIKAYAALYGVHRNTVTKWAQAGLLIVWRTQQTVRIKNTPPTETPHPRHLRKPCL